ncbi:hypothetical protein GCM10009006_09560 [Haloarcula argentinensis]|uniref:Uncharacterized protein n=1 Tax=Haloarcula argentinensis TaxID=43776 RepID=A0A830FJV2_HALAR|nr:hypothetical protein GCM10009006_09560 [Haloarcula argentinensis]
MCACTCYHMGYLLADTSTRTRDDSGRAVHRWDHSGGTAASHKVVALTPVGWER